MNTFLHWMLVYFEAVFLYLAEHTGATMLPMLLVAIIPGSAILAMAVSSWARFKLLHIVCEVVFNLGLCVFASQSESTTLAEWATFQIICALCGGIVLDPCCQLFKLLSQSQTRQLLLQHWAFIRTVGGVWGVAIPATIFNNRVYQLADAISDPKARQLMVRGDSNQYASATFVNAFAEPVRGEIRHVYSEALKLVFLTAVAFGTTACVLFLFERDVEGDRKRKRVGVVGIWTIFSHNYCSLPVYLYT